MIQNASKQGKLDYFVTIFVLIVLPCMWGLGFQNDSLPRIQCMIDRFGPGLVALAESPETTIGFGKRGLLGKVFFVRKAFFLRF